MDVIAVEIEGGSQRGGIDEEGLGAVFGAGIEEYLVEVLVGGFVWGFVFGVEDEAGLAGVFIGDDEVDDDLETAVRVYLHIFLRLERQVVGQIPAQPLGHKFLIQGGHIDQEGNHNPVANMVAGAGLFQEEAAQAV